VRPAIRLANIWTDIGGIQNRSEGKLYVVQTAALAIQRCLLMTTDPGEAKSNEAAWMRLTLDTIGKIDWPSDRQGRPLYPEGFSELSRKLGAHYIHRGAMCAALSAWGCSPRDGMQTP
jgi:hypothetical protein